MRGLLAIGCVAMASVAAAQATVRPDLVWRALEGPHVRVVFEPGLEPLARRVVVVAESAYVALARELTPPRGRIDLILADNVDYANGAATPFPSNRIVLYARPPIEQLALRPHEDWMRLLVTHEMAHLFHLDRVRGLWAVGQRVFGRAAPLFPNAYAPSWVLEGLAVHYESRLGGGGRLRGSEFPAVARAAALDGVLPPLDAVSADAPRFPLGQSVYVYGAFAMSRGDTTGMRRYVEESSRRLFVSRLDARARTAFGVTFRSHWEAWRDSVTRDAAGLPTPSSASLRSREGYTARHPRFVDDTVLRFVADEGRRVPGFYEARDVGRARRIGRRNSVDVSARAGARATIAAELDYTDPYTVRSALYLEPDGAGARRRFSTATRLSQPDVHRSSGRIVAVRTQPGTTDLVTLEGPEATVEPLVLGSLDETWGDPRWSRDGGRVVAVRWRRGGRLAVVVLDTVGRLERTFSPRPRVPGWLTVVSSPVWEPGDTTVLFVSDHEGRAMVYRGDVRTGAMGLVWATRTALQTPDVSPSGARIAAVELRGDGFHVVTRETPTVPLREEAMAPRDSLGAATPVESTTTMAVPYASAGELVPTWWLPVAGPSGPGSWSIGVMTSARDLVGRHAFAWTWARDLERPEVSSSVAYQYAGFGNPVVGVTYASGWQHLPVRQQDGTFAGWLGERTRRGGVQVTRQRVGIRWSGWAALGAEVEAVDYQTDPLLLRARLTNPRFRETAVSQVAQLSTGFSTMQRPTLSVSAEDGVTASAVLRRRFGGAVGGGDVSEAIGAATGAIAVPWPGFARAVVAGRVAAGWTASASQTGFSVGGVNGTSIALLPGLVIGGSPRTFGVRGFDTGALSGTRAAVSSVEVRLPLTLLGRGVRGTSVFLQKASLAAYADGGAAWCDRAVAGSLVCPAPVAPRRWLGSVGGELGVDAALRYDVAYRFRFGAAHPVGGLGSAPSRVVLYFSMGSTF
ncbi:MAG: hypothetical protein P3A32_01910 [Gemmatimonadota bacterium]|nr:hypothetical protein [Gemmatimonadota bacterium]MDQ8146849.1 hypothetical protein [Gemmatimonadota bacterium]MDQ8148565.1 hypothetical protein [Gemmatimonadota bacterium]MDQ8156448.1 hypothetical protein [Gemmatimonadota bacterium]MDQ8176276.1 hypothetical protein [Gemmatimonadota bacterium]